MNLSALASAGLTLVIILTAVFSLGWLILRQLTASQSFSGTHLELIFATIAMGIIIIGWLAFVLAEIGKFAILTLAFLWAGTLFFLIWRIQRKKINFHTSCAPPQDKRLLSFLPDWVEYAALGIWAITAVFLFMRPHQFIIGGADAGVYVNLGANIAETGSILIQDEVLATLPTDLYPAFLRPLTNSFSPHYIFPAFYVIGEPIGEITPQFYHLHSVWMAIASSLNNNIFDAIQAELLLSGLWGILASLAIYFTVRRVAGWETALLALAGLTINALQIWFTRYPTTETLTQFLLWTGLWSLGVWIEKPESRSFWGLLAGLAIGQSFLVRIDMLFILPVLGLFGLWLWIQQGWKYKIYNYFFLPLLLLILHSLIHALWQSRPYFFDLFGFALQLLRVNWLIPFSAILLGLLLLIGIGRYRNQLNKLGRYKRPFLGSIAFVFIIWFGYNWFLRPRVGDIVIWSDPYSSSDIPQINHENLVHIGWYLSPLGVWLGIIGIGLLIWKMEKKTAVMLAISLLLSLIYITNIRANPHQIYAMRRYVPAIMPMFVIGAAYFLSCLITKKQKWLSILALILAIGWLAGSGWLGRGFVTQIDYSGLLPQFDQFDGQLTKKSILIFNDPDPIGQGDFIGTPLRFIKGYNVLTLRNIEALDKLLFSKTLHQWRNEGYDVYWLTKTDGPEWPLPDWALHDVGKYDIQTSALEGSYTHRPTQINTLRWQGQILAIQPSEK